MYKKKKKIRGFTLVELMVVVFIIVLFSVLALANYRSGQRQFALIKSANELAQNLREAAKRAMITDIKALSECGGRGGGRGPPGSLPQYGYGIHLESASSSYFLFLDCDGDGEKKDDDKILKEFFLASNIQIVKIEPDPPLHLQEIDIVFCPPDPKVKFSHPGVNSIGIILQNTIEQNQIKVTVYKTGAIKVGE